VAKRGSTKKFPRKKKSLQTNPISENALDSRRTIDFRGHLPTLLVCLVLILATSAVYWHVTGHDFVNLDDNIYVYENRHVQNGLTLDSMLWAFTTTGIAYWHPMTWLSLMVDHEFYGLNSSGYHLTNLLFHTISTLLLFLVLKRMTGAPWRSAFVAALFALHPLNVESVAWVTERKNVLSTFFWVLTMWGYARYVERPGINRYLLVLLPFGLGLMAKPMLVTLPCVLLLLDYWPLGRFQLGQFGKEANEPLPTFMNQTSRWLQPSRLVLEKIPFLVLAVVSIYLSSLSVKRLGNAITTEAVPMSLRVANALVSYVGYIGKMIWPANLAVFYPPPKIVPGWQVAAAGLFLVFVSILVIRAVRLRPYLAVGWLWYLGTLVPVIGLVRAGLWPYMADRFAYVPLMGLFIIIAWGVPEVVARWHYRKIGIATTGAALLSILMVTTWLQVRYWKNGIRLFEHALDVTSNNYVAHYTLGNALDQTGHTDDAIKHYQEALRINPAFVNAHNNLGVALDRQGRTDNAIKHFLIALRIRPDDAEAHNNLGVALDRTGRTDDAIKHYQEALRINPDDAEAHNNLGVALYRTGRTDDAMKHYQEALRINPDDAEAHNNLGISLYRKGRTDDAIKHYLEALRFAPDDAEAHSNLGIALYQTGRIDDAIKHYQEALRINPDDAETHHNLGNALDRKGRTDDAMKHYQEALRINPDDAETHNNLGVALYRTGRTDDAMKHYQEALRFAPDYAEAYYNLGIALDRKGRTDDAVKHYQEALRIKSDYAEAHNNLGNALDRKGRTGDAMKHYLEALRIDPDYAEAHNNLGISFARKGNVDVAVKHFQKALQIDPNFFYARDNLKKALLLQERNQ
jgi:Flp pilus assembly protein TadD